MSEILMPEKFIRKPFFLYQLQIGQEAWAEPTALLVNIKREVFLNLSAEGVPVILGGTTGGMSPAMIHEAISTEEPTPAFMYRWTMRVYRRAQHEWTVDISHCNRRWTQTDFGLEFAPPGEFFVRPVALIFKNAPMEAAGAVAQRIMKGVQEV